MHPVRSDRAGSVLNWGLSAPDNWKFVVWWCTVKAVSTDFMLNPVCLPRATDMGRIYQDAAAVYLCETRHFSEIKQWCRSFILCKCFYIIASLLWRDKCYKYSVLVTWYMCTTCMHGMHHPLDAFQLCCFCSSSKGTYKKVCKPFCCKLVEFKVRQYLRSTNAWKCSGFVHL